MKTDRNLYVFLFTVYIVTITFLVLHNLKDEDLTRSLQSKPNDNNPRFENPLIAYHILSKLDVYEPIYTGLSAKKLKKMEYNRHFSGLKTDDSYCDKHRVHFAYNPDFIFNEKNFVTSYKRSSDLRKHWISQVGGNDTMPHVHGAMDDSLAKQELFDIRTDTNMFFLSSFFRRKINQQFACTTQWLNHIPGHEAFVRKDSMAKLVQEYKKKYEKQPQCLDTDKFFPKTYALYEKQQCLEFFKGFNSPKYQELKAERKIVYFRKIGRDMHRGLGVFPVDDKEEAYVRELYKNGELCGQIMDNNLMQTYIHNPLLMEGRKTDFRFYILIASTNPLIAYYNDGYFSVSLTQFDANATDKGTVMTNYRLAAEYFNEMKEKGMYEGMTNRDMWNDTIWTFERLQSYLLVKGLIKDTNWLDNYLRPELKKMTIHIMRMARDSLVKRSSVFEYYGIDVVMDTDFGLWFIEANTNPDMEEFPVGTDKVVKDFISDSFDTLFGLLKSRAKRIINYVNKLTNSPNKWKIEDKELHLFDQKKRIEEFKAVSSNYFEPEYEITPRGQFHKVVDENYSGPERYSHLIPVECF